MLVGSVIMKQLRSCSRMHYTRLIDERLTHYVCKYHRILECKKTFCNQSLIIQNETFPMRHLKGDIQNDTFKRRHSK